MLLFILAYAGGVLTILSPCVLPVVPFIFSRSDQPFYKSGLPMLIGMAFSFALFAALSVAGGHWIVSANQWGRWIALVIFTLLGLSLLFSRFAEQIARPFVRLGGALQKKADARVGVSSSLLLGASVGLLWAPCAGPILGLVLAGASVGDSSNRTFALLFAFALGAASSLGIAIFVGGKALKFLKKGLGAEEWIKRGLGVAVLCGVVAIAFGLDTRILAKLSFLNTNEIEQKWVEKVSGPEKVEKALADEGVVPSLDGANLWLNSTPLTSESLRGKVVLVDFWTYSCINCLRTLPYVKAWAEKYKDRGLVVIGVHTPEFAFEEDEENVKNALKQLGVNYPVAVDNDRKIWAAFHNRYWPAHYFIDAQGRIRHHHFGEGHYDESEAVIQKLLAEIPGNSDLAKTGTVSIAGSGVEAAPSVDLVSPETYVGYARQHGFVSKPAAVHDRQARYELPTAPALNRWGLIGSWKVSSEMAEASSSSAIVYQFEGRDLHLVIGAPEGKRVRFRVTLDGKALGENHGQDTDADGNGVVDGHRLYQLIRVKGPHAQHLFQIEFLDSGAEVFAFTFG